MTNELPEAAITVEGLTKRYGELVAVDDLSFSVRPGSVTGFLGPNGAGKTTTLRMLTTLLEPSAGQATVAGQDLAREPREVRRRIGYVAQVGSAPSAGTIVGEELVTQARLQGLSKADATRRLAQVAPSLALDGLERRSLAELSGGQRRRFDVALGLMHTPSVVFLDEPTTGLDPQSRANLWEHIRALRAEHQVTVFLTTHYLDEADSLCDRILVIDHGRIVAEGTPDELKAQLSGDGIAVAVPPESVTDAAEIAGRLPGASEIATSPEGTVRFRVPRGDTALPELLRALDAKAIAMTSIQVQRPSLDDVFLAMTGRTLRDAEEGEV
jgi:ABC-2 type transport system ATP-binding protein